MDNLFYFIETMGIATFALSGIFLAEKKDLDLVGWYIIACVTAFGGGTVRDLILDVTPVFWIRHWEYPFGILFLVMVLYYARSMVSGIRKVPEVCFIATDALGIALFAISGADIAIQFGCAPFIVMIMAVITASFGGLIRDVLCNEVPMLFQKVSLYGSIVFFGAGLYLILLYFNVDVMVSTYVSVLGIFLGRMLAYRFNWRFK